MDSNHNCGIFKSYNLNTFQGIEIPLRIERVKVKFNIDTSQINPFDQIDIEIYHIRQEKTIQLTVVEV